MANYSTVKSYFESTLIHSPKAQADFTPTLNNARITGIYQDEHCIGFEAVSTTKEGACRHCGQVLTRFKQYRTNYLTLARYNAYKIVLKFHKKMYYCMDCKASTTEQPMKDRAGQRQSTNACINSMVGCLKENLSFSCAARFYRVSPTTVTRAFDRAELKQTKVDRQSVRNLSVDETRFIQKRGDAAYQFVIIDSDKNQVLDILPSRHAREVESYLKAHYQDIETFTQDLWRPYQRAACRLFEGVKVVADCFHVVRLFMWAFSRTRIALAKEHRHKTCRHWKILTKAMDKLDERGKERLEGILNQDKRLRQAHEVKEMALALFRSKDSAAYLKALPAFEKAIEQYDLKEFKKALGSIRNWHEEILHMFDHDYSNGSAERINRTIKQARNIAFGFGNLARATRLVQYRVN